MKSELKNFLRDDRAIAAGYLIIVVVMVVAGIVIVILTPMVDTIFSSFNTQVGEGYISQQTYDVFNFNRTAFVALPIFTVFGLLAWGIVKALERKWEGG